MSITSEINRISQNVSGAMTAIANKGVTVPAGSTSDDLADLISEIETGGEITITDEKDAGGGINRSIDTGINKIKRIVKGTAPLSLTMVKPGPMTRLTQYGKIEIVGTPSPTSPATIKCNNGTLTAVDDELPTGYRRVADLTLVNARFVTNLNLTGADTLRFSAGGRSGNWIGAYNSPQSNDNYSFYATTSAGGNYLRYDGDTYNSAISNDTRYDIVITPTGCIGNRTPSSWTQKSFTCPVKMCIGGTAPDGTPAPNVTFYGTIQVDGKAKYIPCERLSDNALGYYDTSEDEFLEEDTGTGTVTTSGYDSSHMTWRIIGTAEEITIGNTTAETDSLLEVGEHREEQDIISGEIFKCINVDILDGEISYWEKVSGVNAYYYMDDNIHITGQAEPGVSSHFIGSDAATADMPDNSIKIVSDGIIIRKNDITSAEDFLAYCGAQLAAGTPIIVLTPTEGQTESMGEVPITLAGDTTVTMTAEISGIELEAEYEGQVGT